MNPLSVAAFPAIMQDLSPARLKRMVEALPPGNPIICALCGATTGVTLRKIPNTKAYVCQACFKAGN